MANNAYGDKGLSTAVNQNVDDVINIQLERVRKGLKMMFERDGLFFSSVEENTDVEVINRRKMRVGMKLRPGGSFGYFNSAGGSLGPGTGNQYQAAFVEATEIKLAIAWDAQAKWSTNNDRKSLENGVQETIADAMAEFRRHVNANCMGDGTGVIGSVTASARTVVNNVATNELTLGNNFGAKLVRPNQIVDLIDTAVANGIGANNSRIARVMIDYVDIPNKKVFLKDRVFAAGNAGGANTLDTMAEVFDDTNGLGKAGRTVKLVVEGIYGGQNLSSTDFTAKPAINGIEYHNSNATSGMWQDMDRSKFPEIRTSNVNAAGAFSITQARRAVNYIGDIRGIDNDTKLTAWCHPAHIHSMEDTARDVLATADRMPNNKNVNMFYGNFQLAGAPAKADFSWNKSRIDFNNMMNWGRVEMAPVDWYEVGGTRQFPAYDSDGQAIKTRTVTYLVCSMNLYNTDPASNAYISGITIPTGY